MPTQRFNREYDALSTNFSQYEISVQDKVSLLNSAEAALATKNIEIARLREQFESTETSDVNFVGQLESRTKELEDLSTAYSHIADKLEQKEAELLKSKDALATRDEDIAALKTSITAGEGSTVALQDELSNKAKELEDLSAAYNDICL